MNRCKSLDVLRNSVKLSVLKPKGSQAGMIIARRVVAKSKSKQNAELSLFRHLEKLRKAPTDLLVTTPRETEVINAKKSQYLQNLIRVNTVAPIEPQNTDMFLLSKA